MPTKPLSPSLIQKILKLRATINPSKNKPYTVDEISRLCDVSTGVVSKYLRKQTQEELDEELETHRKPILPSKTTANDPYSILFPPGDTVMPLPDLLSTPLAHRNVGPAVFNFPGVWGVISDIHVPFHDPAVLRLFAKVAKKRAFRGLLLNGDIHDFYQVSDHLRDPSLPSLKRELEVGQALLTWLRQLLPDATIVYREGNHEERLSNYIFRHCPQLFGLDALNFASLAKLADHGIEHLGDKRLLLLGKLPIVHGHEHRQGIAAPVNPARGLFLRSKQSAMMSHCHQVSSHQAKTLEGKPIVTWSIGCACDLKPNYAPYNDWSHGFAVVTVANDGSYHVENLCVRDGEIL